MTKWKEFNIEAILTPYEIVDKSLEGFSEATRNLVELSLFEKSEIELIRKKKGSNFQYDLVLHTRHMRSYKFVVFELYFDVTLYPSILKPENSIARELGSNEYIISDNAADLEKAIEIIFSTKKFNEIVGGLMKIASLSKEEEEELPF